MTEEDLKALTYFIACYPTWWWKIGWCDVTRDFDAAPQGHSPEAVHIKSGNDFDGGFRCDHRGNIADAIFNVIYQIRAAIERIEDA